jgi:hypothetical protein
MFSPRDKLIKTTDCRNACFDKPVCEGHREGRQGGVQSLWQKAFAHNG